jgi:mannose-6-phosphate isomerase-like protein (cupin superfamily)
MSKPVHDLNLASTYVQLRNDGVARLLPVTDSFWPDLAAGNRPDVNPGRLVSMFDFAEDWRNWERHPAGDELVILLSGSAEMLMEQEQGILRKQLGNAGDYVLVPKNTWHTVHTRRCAMLFVTPGEGTEHKPV